MLQKLKKRVKQEGERVEIDARGIHYRELNRLIHELVDWGAKKFKLLNINGQRYIADGLKGEYHFEIHGIAGDDLASFADGAIIEVYGNIQDGAGNTMNNGRIVVHGSGTDIIGHSMRGGRIFVRDEVGYRVGIHMKEYKHKFPIIVVGGTAGDFLGEYMAGGRIIVLGLKKRGEVRDIVGNWLATGIHGGAVYIRGNVPEEKLGVGAKIVEMDEEDEKLLEKYVKEFCSHFGLEPGEILSSDFTKVAPLSHKPFAAFYSDSGRE